MDREYYQHFAGHKTEFEIEPIYERHAGLFGRAVVDELRELRDGAAPGTSAGGCAICSSSRSGGLIGRETKEQEAALAEREAALEIEVDGAARGLPAGVGRRRPTSPTPERRADDRARAAGRCSTPS